MEPPPRSLALDAHYCIMVRVAWPTEYKYASAIGCACWRAPLGIDSVPTTTCDRRRTAEPMASAFPGSRRGHGRPSNKQRTRTTDLNQRLDRNHPIQVLAVVQHEAPLSQMPVENREADLRRVRLEGELRFGCEHAPEGEPISAADQVAVRAPHLERVGVAGVERLGVGGHDPRRDPSQRRLAGAGLGAGPDHVREGAIERHPV